MDTEASTAVAIDTSTAAETSAVGAKRRKPTKTNKVAQIQVSVLLLYTNILLVCMCMFQLAESCQY